MSATGIKAGTRARARARTLIQSPTVATQKVRIERFSQGRISISLNIHFFVHLARVWRIYIS